MKNKYFRHLKRVNPRGIQSTIMFAFSMIAISTMLIVGIAMYIRFSASSRQEIIQSSQKLMEQAGENLEDYLLSMRQISDAVYYNVIKENDISNKDNDIQRGMNLLYEANRDNLRSIAIYNNYGSLLAAEPVASQKEDPNVTSQDWYIQARAEMENMHFSTPHIQNLFHDASFRYYWVISLSRVVELTNNGDSQLGVLLVDMDYSNISRMMKQINTSNNGQYYYLCDSNGQIIYHMRQIQISDGISSENSKAAAKYKDGIYDEVFEGEHRKVIVNTISYTGWKLVGVIPYSAFTHGMVNVRYFIAGLMFFMALMLVIINRLVSVKISDPILKLNHSVMEYEAGEKPEIYIGGSQEIRHLAQSIQRSYEQIDTLMREIILEQNERRKSELDALQSQINPHFLYNALESITWMVEGERNDDAVFMISQLAKLFRISLSKGRTIISVSDELQHAQSYMNIQKIRYKNAFSVVFQVDPAICSYCTVKLILQPILENAINYGVNSTDDCAEITVTGRQEEDKIILSVTDNGMGMSKEEVSLLLTDSNRVHKHGSGVGLVNVNNRIRIVFGKEYGLIVESEPDRGTTVSVCIPAVPYTEENRKILEKGNMFNREEMIDKKIQGK
ncbi:cache domain-containing sensor histidine kinase [Diplocloster modestus]|uniref:histidine kinase n=1 Tax=Diplocloster modestus TaxID=2850322 RepID=A0ABS6KB05_9FIRM|nr:sensor histidine kinase [Diplocloster modestus]